MYMHKRSSEVNENFAYIAILFAGDQEDAKAKLNCI